MQSNLVKSEHIAEGRWGDILTAAGVDPLSLTKKMGPCPMCGGKTRCYALDVDEGRLYCHRCGPLFGFQVLMHHLNRDFRGAAEWIRQWHGGCGEPIVRKQPVGAGSDTPGATDEAVRAKLRKLWDESRPIAEGSPVHRYLLKRLPGLRQLPGPDVLREIAELDYWDKDEKDRPVKRGRYPCMLARVQGVDGKGVNVWRTYVSIDGDKAPVSCPKKASGRFLGKGYAVRLAKPSDVLGISEGIETAMSAQLLRGIPTWSTLSANGMRTFEMPHELRSKIRRVTIFADNDDPDQLGRRAGNDAAQALKAKLVAEGRRVDIIMPTGTAFDLNDVLHAAARRKAR